MEKRSQSTQIELFFGLMAVVCAFFQISGGELSDYVLRKECFTLSDLISTKNDPHLIAHCLFLAGLSSGGPLS